MTHLQDEIQDKISTFGEEISEKVHIDQWRNASRSDFNKIQDQIEKLSLEMNKLNSKIDKINKKK